MRKDHLNLGCGSRVHDEWLNIDIAPAAPGVVRHDLSRGIPAASGSARAVYHSHLIEHLRRDDARRFLDECFRVLAPGGVIRIATPDLEQLCRDYLAALDAGARDDAEWMRIELLDQLVREQSGGTMAAFLARNDIPNLPFIRRRIGAEADTIIRAPRRKPTLGAIVRFGIRLLRRGVVFLIAGRSGLRAYDAGTFRFSGEAHQWLYDRYSLADLLREAGFADPRVESATTGRIAGWAVFQLDAGEDGAPFKPDSLYMEAVKPAVS